MAHVSHNQNPSIDKYAQVPTMTRCGYPPEPQDWVDHLNARL